ncbi:hypothetical protein CLU81_2784 [Flavobacterium sp. 9]|uniref:hypothetical protein n=1 Tax=Flavobacterium sp. 9 TaxID=2035198 RepID=UPI000C19AFB5|nr:hypothetical protein [Flavobacterium sp. 9]PIF32262.1 hypothetical protein CLU81_2784 [Flavobacterium sp. 9]
MKYKLNHEISFLYRLVFKIIFIGSLGFVIYSILIEEVSAIISCVLLSSWGFFLNKRFKRFKTIEFDENAIYFDDIKIDLKNIEKIGMGKIIFKATLEEKPINFFYSPLFDSNFNLLKTFHQKQI